jgi:hypothetical protein
MPERLTLQPKNGRLIMRHNSWSIGVFAIACGLLAHATAAQAVPATWVSGTGADTGTCPISAPCRTFLYAHSQTTANGTINVLSSGNFGPAHITKPISIVAEGVEALIDTPNNGTGLHIQVPNTGIVSLRGLTIDMRGTPNSGIFFSSGAALHVHNSVIRRTFEGIRFAPSVGTSELYVADSVFADSSFGGIDIVPSGNAGARVVLDRIRVENSVNTGIWFRGEFTSGMIRGTVRDSVSAGGGSQGIRASEGGGGTTTVMIDRTAAVNNITGIEASGAGATIRIGDSTVSGNDTGLSTSGGAIASYGTNKVNGNTNDGVTPSPIDMK